MNKLFRNKSTLFCFTPGVMLATFLIEIVLAIYVFVRYKLSAFGRLAALIILVLALFQAAEYQVCRSTNPILWSHIGFSLITLLPVLGLHLISYVTGKKHFLAFGYALVLAFMAIFIFSPKAITSAVCGGNYIIFETTQQLSWIYGVYYFGFLLLGVWEVVEKLFDIRKRGVDRKKIAPLWWMLIGYASFLVPMGVVYAISREARSATTSIMCGFALILAFIMVFKVMPLWEGVKKNE